MAGGASSILSDVGRLPDREARPYALGEESIHPIAKMAGLERIAERMARQLRFIVEPMAKVRTEVVALPIDTVRFDAWKAELPSFTSLSLFRLRPMKAGMLVVVDPPFVTRLIDSFYGGSGKTVRPAAREFTPTEDRLVGRLTDSIVEKLVEIWNEVLVLTPSLAGRETKAAYATLVRADEAVVVQGFTVTPAGGLPSTISLVYSLAAIRPFEAQLAAKVHDEAGPADAEWRERLAQALENVRLPVRSVLARPELSVSQLMQLKVGDVIPITLAPKAPLIVANRKLAHGTIGEREGRAALMIEQIEGSGSGDSDG